MNLIRNAAQVGSPLETLEIAVSVETDRVVLLFQDDGPGIPAEAVSRVFQRGISLRGGSGLGLALVQEVVEADHGGKVEYVASALGGAGFRLSLPLARGGVG